MGHDFTVGGTTGHYNVAKIGTKQRHKVLVHDAADALIRTACQYDCHPLPMTFS